MADTSIDPITGAPLVGVPDYRSISQIPLGAQVFPWDDVSATAQPTDIAAYPDDVLPTSALVAGYNQTNTKKVQSVYTDGNHNLRVNVAGNSSGVGGSPWHGTNVGGWNSEILPVGPGNFEELVSGLTLSQIHGVVWSIYADPLEIAKPFISVAGLGLALPDYSKTLVLTLVTLMWTDAFTRLAVDGVFGSYNYVDLSTVGGTGVTLLGFSTEGNVRFSICYNSS